MKNYWNDYKVLCKETGVFYKKHWLGTIILTVVGMGLYVLSLATMGLISFKKKENDSEE